MSDVSPRVFISYSHDSEAHRQSVLDLANKLRNDGVDVRIDRYALAPPEGWPRWMENQIEEARFVLMICTQIYYERVSQNADAGVGLGALWESNIIYNMLYQAGTMNSKFIPVLPVGGEIEHIPIPLRSAQRYQPFTEGDGYLDLYRFLTNQPAVVMPPLGSRKALSPLSRTAEAPLPAHTMPISCSSSPRAGIWVPSDSIQAFIPVIESQWGAREITMSFEADDSGEGAFLDGLRQHRQNLLLGYRNNVGLVAVQDVQHQTQAGKDRWQVTFRLERTDFADSFEFNTSGLTADQAAIQRAKRLLLNDNPAPPKNHRHPWQDTILQELLISGQGTPIQIRNSPFPDLFRSLGSNEHLFIQAAWISAILHLKLSNTVEQVSRLELTLADNALHVEFEGRRRKQYANRPALNIQVSGSCSLIQTVV